MGSLFSTNVIDVSDCFRIKSDLNIADIWQSGPNFLKSPLHEWPIAVTPPPPPPPPENLQVIDINRFYNCSCLICITARILNMKNLKPTYSLSYVRHTVTTKGLESTNFDKDCHNSIKSELNKSTIGKGQYRNLNLKKRLADDIFIVKGRTEAWNELLNNDELSLLPKRHRFEKLYAEYIHNSNHLHLM